MSDGTNNLSMQDGDRATEAATVARHWVDLYRELIPFEEQVLARAEELVRGRSEAVLKAVRETNLQPLAELIEEFRVRLMFWRARLHELQERPPAA
ncbi:MAG: hypothetical protein WBD38_09910 [Candidatus Dormiibacterota bacterium]